MAMYIYPQNLKATANLWLWCLRDFAIICVGLLVSVLALTKPLFSIPTHQFLFNAGSSDPVCASTPCR